MSHCMHCGVGITAENYNMNWTLRCNSCHAQYNEQQKQKLQQAEKEAEAARIEALEKRVAELEKGAKK